MTQPKNLNILLLLLLLALPAAGAKDAFYIEPLNIVPGDTKTLCLSLDNTTEYKGFQTDLVLPAGLSVVTQTNGAFDIMLTDRASSSFMLSSNEVSSGTIRMVCFSSQNETFSGKSGKLVKIQIKASDSFTGGNISLQNSIFSDTSDKDVKMDPVKIQVLSEEQNYLTVNAGELAAGEGASFPLLLRNDAAFTAYQLDVVLPAGLTLDLSKCSMTERCSSNHQLTTKDMGNGTYRIICMSMNNALIEDNHGALLNLWIQSENATKGEKTIQIKNMMFSDAKAQSYPLDAVSFNLDVKYTPVSSITLNETSATMKVGADYQLQATVLPENSSNKTVIWESSDKSIATVDDSGKITAIAEGQCTVTVYSADRSIKSTCKVTVEKIPLTARVENATRVYGEENPAFKITYSGFLEGDSEADFSAKPTITTTAEISSHVGDYEIVASGAVSVKYNITYTAGTLTITKAPLTISAGTYTKKQGDAMPEFKANYSGFKNNDTEAVLTKKPTFSTEVSVASAPNEYAITIGGAEAQDYEISYEQGKLTVTQADPVVIRAKSYSRTYGDANPTFEYEVEGAKLDGMPEITCVADKASAVGTYAIEVKQGTVKNYNVSFVAGTLNITKAPLTISAGTYTKKQGDAMPEFKASYSGFKNNDTEAVLTKKPTFSTEATVASAPSEYVVTVSGAEAQDYEISYEQGKLTVTQADPVVIRAKSYSRTYGDANPTFEYEVEGAKLDGMPELSCSASPTSSVGTYTIEVKQGTVKNYNVSFVAGTLTITKAPLTISAGTYTKKQGDAMPEFKASYSGFKNDDTEAVLTKNPTFSTEATVASAPSEYAVTISGAETQNYEISYEQGKLTVTQADPVVIRAKSYSRTYGDANPTFEYEVEGAKLDGTPEITCVADKVSAVGTYTIEVKQGTVKNYNVSFVAGTLTVTKAPLTISAGTYTKKQGDAMPEFKASYSGFKNDDTEAVLTKKPTFSTEASVASAPSEYAVTISGAEAQNYEISYEQGKLKIFDSKQTIAWDKSFEPKTGTSYTMNATASSGLPITYSYARPMEAWQIPTINGNEIIFPSEGSYMIVATQNGNEEYDAVSDTLEVCALDSDEGLMYVDGIYYRYADDEHKTLKVVRGYKVYAGDIVIPETVNGLPVVEMDAQAMYACYDLHSVVISDGIAKMGTECLGANPKLTVVTLPYIATEIPDYFFNCDNKLTEIHCRANSPYAGNESVFNGYVDYTSCVLYVPRGTKEAYAAHHLWGKFMNIEEEEVVTGIQQVENSVNDNDAWYTLSGIKLPGKPTANGVYIHGGKKLIIKNR